MKAIRLIIFCLLFSPPFLTSFSAFFYSAGSDFQGCQAYFSTSVIPAAALSGHQSSCVETQTSLFYSLKVLPASRLLHIPVIPSSCWLALCSEIPKSDLDLLRFTWAFLEELCRWAGHSLCSTSQCSQPGQQAPPWGQGHQLIGQSPNKEEPQVGKEENNLDWASNRSTGPLEGRVSQVGPRTITVSQLPMEHVSPCKWWI